MKHPELVKKGHKYAFGEGVMVDSEKAFNIWSLVEYDLDGEDLEEYVELCAYYDKEFISPFDKSGSLYNTYGDLFVTLSAKIGEHHSEAEIRCEFDAIMKGADDVVREKLYKLLKSVKEGKKPRERTEKNINTGNNLGFVMLQYSLNRSIIHDKVNELLEKRFNTEEKNPKEEEKKFGWSQAAISQALNGVNGISSAVRTCIVCVLNNIDAEREKTGKAKIVYEPLKENDFDLKFTDLFKRFVNPKVKEKDEKLRKLCDAAGLSYTMIK